MRIAPQATIRIPVQPRHEHALLAVRGLVEVDGMALGRGPLLYLGADRHELGITAGPEGALALLLGGEPLGEDLVMWWNFVGRSHEEIVAAREDWEARSPRFGEIPVHGEERIPAPPLPNVRLTPRRRLLEP